MYDVRCTKVQRCFRDSRGVFRSFSSMDDGTFFENNLWFLPVNYFHKMSTIMVDQYLVGFWICAEISVMSKKNRLEKLVSPVKRSAWLDRSTLKTFDRCHLFDVNEVSMCFHEKFILKRGGEYLKRINYKSLEKLYKKHYKSSFKRLQKRFIIVQKSLMNAL